MLLALLPQLVCFADGTPIGADRLSNGVYSNVEVTSSSSMFRVTDCTLTVSDGKMNAVITLSGKGYGKLFMGTSEEASAAPDSDCIYFEENANGEYTYTVPVDALDADISCAAWSTRKEQWYDRTLVFNSSSLPADAIKSRSLGTLPMMCIAAAACLAVTAVVKIRKRKA